MTFTNLISFILHFVISFLRWFLWIHRTIKLNVSIKTSMKVMKSIAKHITNISSSYFTICSVLTIKRKTNTVNKIYLMCTTHGSIKESLLSWRQNEVCWLVLMGQQLKVPLGPQVSQSHPERCSPGQWSRAEQEIDADLTPNCARLNRPLIRQILLRGFSQNIYVSGIVMTMCKMD